MRYRRRSIVVEAFGRVTSPGDADRIRRWAPGIVTRVYPMVDGYGREGLVVRSRVGDATVPYGFWLVRSPVGNLAAIDPVAFENAYEPEPALRYPDESSRESFYRRARADVMAWVATQQ